MGARILATGDLHIGQRVSGINDISGISAKETWENMVRWAIDNKIDAITLSGDIIDRNNRYYEAKGPLERGFQELKNNNICVFMVAGNHDFDVLPQVVRAGAFSNVRLLGANGTWEIAEFRGIQFAGWSFPSEHYYDDPLKTFDQSLIRPDMPSIGLLHGDLFDRTSRYAPLNLDLLKSRKLSTWILGHIHKVSEWQGMPYVCYTGSPLALGPNETGLHGPLLFEVNDNVVSYPLRKLHSAVRFEPVNIDVTGAGNEESFRSRVSDSIREKNSLLEKELSGIAQLSYRINFTGSHNNAGNLSAWSKELCKDYRTEFNGTAVSFTDFSLNIAPVADLKELSADSTPIGSLARMILALENDQNPEFLGKMIGEWKTMYTGINNYDLYDAVRNQKTGDPELEKAGRKYILRESRRLISELLLQKNDK